MQLQATSKLTITRTFGCRHVSNSGRDQQCLLLVAYMLIRDNNNYCRIISARLALISVKQIIVIVHFVVALDFQLIHNGAWISSHFPWPQVSSAFLVVANKLSVISYGETLTDLQVFHYLIEVLTHCSNISTTSMTLTSLQCHILLMSYHHHHWPPNQTALLTT